MMNLTITSLVGAILILAGVILTAIQLIRKTRQPSRGADTQIGPLKLALTTTFPGIIMAVLGVILLVVAALTGK